MDYEQIQQENALWPWLADDSMADECYHDWTEPTEADFEFCDHCGAGLTEREASGDACPECGAVWEGGE